MEEVIAVLRLERHQLELLLFKFAEAHLLMAAAELRFLSWSAAEADAVRHRLRQTDLLRAARVERLRIRGLRHGTPTLREIAAASSHPWPAMLRDHHDGLASLVAEVELLGHMNAELARAGMRGISDGRDPLVDGGPGSARRAGARDRRATSAAHDRGRLAQPDLSLLEAESSYQDIFMATTQLRLPALLEFLR